MFLSSVPFSDNERRSGLHRMRLCVVVAAVAQLPKRQSSSPPPLLLPPPQR
jgi:hypothetical protein